MKTRKVKSILLKLKIKGKGIVNYDGGDSQKRLLWNTDLTHLQARHNNVSFAKKNFYKTPDGKTAYEIKISSDCLKHSIFEREVPFQSPNLQHEETVMYSFVGSPAYILRGGLFDYGKGKLVFKRKAPFQIGDAIQTSGAVSILESFSKSGEKKTDNSIDDKSDNTFFVKETVGNIDYETDGCIDLSQLQFVSTDPIFDRLAFNPDNFDLFSYFMKTRVPSFDSKLGYFKMKNSAVNIPEYGFMFKDEDILFMVKHLFRSIIDLNIKRKSAFALTDEFQYKLIYTPSEDTKYKEDGWVSIKNLSDIDNLNFESEDFYVEVDQEEAKNLRKDIEEKTKKSQKESSEKKAEIKSAKEESKKKRTSKKEEVLSE